MSNIKGPDSFVISNPLIAQIMGYLGTRPHNEVFLLLREIEKQLEPQFKKPQLVVPEKSDEKESSKV